MAQTAYSAESSAPSSVSQKLVAHASSINGFSLFVDEFMASFSESLKRAALYRYRFKTKKDLETEQLKFIFQGLFRWSYWPDLNRRPADYESAALPTEPQ